MSADSSKGETGTAGYAGLRYGQRSGRQKFCLQIEWNRGVFRLYTVTIRYGGFSFLAAGRKRLCGESWKGSATWDLLDVSRRNFR